MDFREFSKYIIGFGGLILDEPHFVAVRYNPAGEPCAGKPHARFGEGRGWVTGSSYLYHSGH